LLEYEAAVEQARVVATAVEDGDEDAALAALETSAWRALDAGRHRTFAGGAALAGGGGIAGGLQTEVDGGVNNEEQSMDSIEDSEEVPLFLRRFDAGWVYCQMATVGVSLLERRREHRAAADRLQQLLGGACCPSRRGLWWERLSMNLDHLGRREDALEVAEAALADTSLGPAALLALRRRVLRLGRPPLRWRRPVWAAAAEWEPRELKIEGRPIGPCPVGVKSRFYAPDGEQCSVEELALRHYASSEGGKWRGEHSEGGAWSCMFALLMWPALFAPVPDVFRGPFQAAPLDMGTDGFYPARREALEACLAEVAAGGAPELLRRRWEAHAGNICRGVRWDRRTLNDLQEVARCVGGTALAAVCRLLAADCYGSGGMPDLLLWRPEPGDAKVVEVKGPRDRLSDSQRAWMAAMQAAGLEVEVLRVVEPAVNRG
jgi:fanconi-associated nuclease 1